MPEFKKVITRLMSTGEATIQKLSKTSPVYCYIFDCLYLDGRSLVNEPLLKRKEWLNDAIRTGETPFRVSEIVEDGASLLEAAREHNLEGIMAKKADSKYLPGKRTDCWYKIKIRQSCECMVVGYTQGKGDRNKTFGALQIAENVNGELVYRGKVGTGFDDDTIKEIMKTLKAVEETKNPKLGGGKVVDEKITTWLNPEVIAEISYAKMTTDKMFREPVFLRLRPDL
jgi:ATP-dependent DNA ligase